MGFRGVLGFFLLLSGVSADFKWTNGNCPLEAGFVSDKLCCGEETACKKLSETECKSDANDASLFCQWHNGTCSPFADRESNVCCRGQQSNPCAEIFALKCPKQFQVKKECCKNEFSQKYQFLKTDDESLVCCNAPCTEMEKAGCQLTEKCAPSQRSYAVHHPYEILGFHHGYGYPEDHRFGKVLYGTGFGYDKVHHSRYGRPGYADKDYDHSKEDHVDELTIDDLFLMMIDSMEKETDVKVYDADMTSDPYLGKTKSGGLFVDHHLPDPHYLFDDIYGRKGYYDHYRYPFSGQIYGGYHQGRYGHGYYPDYGYSSDYHSYQPYDYHYDSYGGYGDHHEYNSGYDGYGGYRPHDGYYSGYNDGYHGGYYAGDHAYDEYGHYKRNKKW